MTVSQLQARLTRAIQRGWAEYPVLIYCDGDFDIEDAWLDKSKHVFAIQVLPQVEGLDCIYCGKPTGSNTDMCVPCAKSRLKKGLKP